MRRGAPATRREAIVARKWIGAKQVHGAGVAVVDRTTASPVADTDALVTTDPAVALAVVVADCAPLALASPEGVIAVVHVGWRGLRVGIVAGAVDTMRRLGASAVYAALGPCIRPECYEFSPDDLDAVAAEVGSHVRGTTAGGRAALDLPAGVRVAVQAAGVTSLVEDATCTACSPTLFSHRGGDAERQAVVAWLT